MAASITLHEVGRIEVLGPQTASAVEIANGTVSAALTVNGYYRIAATSACRIRCGMGLSSATDGEYWPDGHVEVRYLREGQVIAVDAL